MTPRSPLRRLNHSAAFTLLEIMLVVMIIALLATAAIHFMGGNLDVARRVRAQTDLQSIATQLIIYESQNGYFPTPEQGLRALVERPTTDPKPRNWMQLLTEIPQDPWQCDYNLEVPARRSKARFDLYSAGPDRLINTADDIGNWDTP